MNFMNAQIVHGGPGRIVPENLTLDSALTASAILADDQILIKLDLDSLCRIVNVRVVRDIVNGCAGNEMIRARKMELEVMRYFRFDCPAETFIRCRCVFDD